IVSKITDCTSSERWYSRYDCGAMLAKLLFNNVENIALYDLPFFSLEHCDCFALRVYLHVRTSAEEGVAANLLSAFNRLEQKGVGFFLSDRKKSRHWCEQVGRDGFDHRHQRGLLCEARELFVVRRHHIGRFIIWLTLSFRRGTQC